MRNVSKINNTNISPYTRFYPSLQSFTGSAISTLIIGKLEYWFSNPKYGGGFYKFVEPCGHPLYREGDSWSEELGVSRKLFAKAFDIIGIRYNSKSAYLKAEDKFQGKLYASYHDRKTNRTYFVRNDEFTSQLLGKLFKRKIPVSSLKKKTQERENYHLKQSSTKNTPEISPSKDLSLETSCPKSASSAHSQGRSCNGELGRSYAHISSFIHKKTSSLESEISNSQPSTLQEKNQTEEMIKIWTEEVGELGSALSHGLLIRLQTAFKEFFNGCIESWKTYCQMISSSKFLMGEAQNKFFKKAWIIWAIRGENIERVRGGDFKLGDRQTNHDKKIDSIEVDIRRIEYKKNQIEMKISAIKSEERGKRKNIVKEKIRTLSKEEHQSLEQAFENHLEQENNSLTEEFRKSRWNGMFISAYFDSFVEEKIYAELFQEEDEDNDEKVVEASGLLELFHDVCHDLEQVKQKKRELESRATLSELRDSRSSPQNRFIDSNINHQNQQIFNPLASSQNNLRCFTEKPLSWV